MPHLLHVVQEKGLREETRHIPCESSRVGKSSRESEVMPAAAPTEHGRGHPGLLQGAGLALPAVHNTGNSQCHLGSERRQRLGTDLWPLSSDCSFTDTLVWGFPFTGETLSQ